MVIHNFQQTVTLADNTVLNGYAVLNEIANDLWVYLEQDTSMATAFSVFSDPSKTAHIRTDMTAEVHEQYDGYTTLALIRQDGGKVSVRLKEGG